MIGLVMGKTIYFCRSVLDQHDKKQQIQIYYVFILNTYKNTCSCALSDSYRCIELHSSLLLLLLKYTISYYCHCNQAKLVPAGKSACSWIGYVYRLEILLNISHLNIGKMSYRCNTNLKYHSIRKMHSSDILNSTVVLFT